MGVQHQILRTQIQGSLAGVTAELDKAVVLLQEQKERVDKLEESAAELRAILEHHDRSGEA